MNDSMLRATAAAMVDNGLLAAGYEYFGLDCYWTLGRDEQGDWIPDPSIFTQGLPDLLAYIRSLGLKVWMYTDRGSALCSGVNGTGSEGHEAHDAAWFAAHGVQFVKEDSCSADPTPAVAFQQYARFRDGLNATGVPIVFNLCGWNPWYAPVGAALGNMWRVSGDAFSWGQILTAIDTAAPLAQYAGPGGFNDLDMMGGSLWGPITPLQRRAQMTVYSMLASPLTLSVNVRNLSSYDKDTYTNSEVIAIDQDELGRQGERVFGGDLAAIASVPLHGPALGLQACVYNTSSRRAVPPQVWSINASGHGWVVSGVPAAGDGYCMAVDDCALPPYDGAVITWLCDSGATTVTGCCPDGCACNLQWALHADGTLRSYLSNGSLCLASNGTAAGVIVAPCDPTSPAQQWYANASDASIRVGAAPSASCFTYDGIPRMNAWAKPLSGGRLALAAMNADEVSPVVNFTCPFDTCIAGMTGWSADQMVTVRDVWSHAWLSNVTAGDGWTTPLLEADGGHAAVVMTPIF